MKGMLACLRPACLPVHTDLPLKLDKNLKESLNYFSSTISKGIKASRYAAAGLLAIHS